MTRTARSAMAVAPARSRCYNDSSMADWRQIQARIRKAKTGADAQAKLSELFQRTRDAMVAWELGLIEEKGARNDEAARWYTIAAQRFRRADWKKKAEEALARLGFAPPAPQGGEAAESAQPAPLESVGGQTVELREAQHELAVGEIPAEDEEQPQPQFPAEAAAGTGGTPVKKRRRGRRGGRGRRRRGAPVAVGGPPTSAPPVAQPRELPQRSYVPRPEPFVRSASEPSSAESARPAQFAPALQLPSERAAHGRAGDPALASRMAQLESMLRRLMAGPIHGLAETEEAPAGPGVFVLSDSDLVTSYYVEACQTLRIGLGNLARGGRSSRGSRGRSDSDLKARLAEHLGITEAKVSQYLKDHCIVRWIQLDDDAQHLAHFAIGVLRTPLNLE